MQNVDIAVTWSIAAPLVVTNPTAPAPQLNVAYSHQFNVTGGTTPYTWSVIAGSLPPGITLNATGLLSGTATTAGSYSFTIRVADAG